MKLILDRVCDLSGHHPVFSNGDHGGTPELIGELQPVLEKYGVHPEPQHYDVALVSVAHSWSLTAAAKQLPSKQLLPSLHLASLMSR